MLDILSVSLSLIFTLVFSRSGLFYTHVCVALVAEILCYLWVLVGQQSQIVYANDKYQVIYGIFTLCRIAGL